LTGHKIELGLPWQNSWEQIGLQGKLRYISVQYILVGEFPPEPP